MIFYRKNNDILPRTAGGGWEPPCGLGLCLGLFPWVTVELRLVTGEAMELRCTSISCQAVPRGSPQDLVFAPYPKFLEVSLRPPG